MRRATVILAVLLFCVTAQAADYYHLRDYVTTKSGYAVSGASVHVYNPNTVVNPTAYTDLAGTAAAFPLTTDVNGMFECYLPDGNYDIVITHGGWNIDTTWDNYMVGGFSDAGVDTLIVTGRTVLGDAATDSLVTRGNQRWQDGNLWRDFSSKVLWFYHTTGTRNQGDGLARTVGFGQRSVQIEEDGALSVAVPVPKPTGDYTYNYYQDYDLISMYTFTGDEDYTYQTLDVSNMRDSLHHWKWQNVIGATDGDVGVAPIGILFHTNLPDSASTPGRRSAAEIWWQCLAGHDSIQSGDSNLLLLKEDGLNQDIDHYRFTPDGMLLKPANDGARKSIRIDGSGSIYTRLGQYGADTGSVLRVAAGLLEVRTHAGGDSALISVASVSLKDAVGLLKLPVYSAEPVPFPTDLGPGSVFVSANDTLYVRNQADNGWLYFAPDGTVSD